MANPNIVNVTNIKGNTSSLVLTTTANPFSIPIVSNPANSNNIYKINTVIVSNIGGAGSREFTLKLFPSADLGSNTNANAIVSTVIVPANASLVVLDKNSSIYLLEDKSLGATANVANVLSVTCSWEEIS